MVYLVDDDTDDLEIFQEALYRNDYNGKVILAPNGKVLMDHLLKADPAARPDLIVLDLNMPLKDGFQALTEIKDDPELKSIPVVILTSSSNKKDELRCFELGCSLFWQKPSSLEEYNTLVTLVKNFLRNSKVAD